MATPPSPRPGTGNEVEASKQIDLLISLAREQAIEATKDSDAIEGKARSFAQVGTVFFAASQATAGILLAARPSHLPPVSETVAWITISLGGLALIAVLCTAAMVMRMHHVVEQQALRPEVLEQLLPFAQDSNRRVPSYLLDELVGIARSRRDVAKKKAGSLRAIYAAGYIALAASGAQVLLGMAVAFATR